MSGKAYLLVWLERMGPGGALFVTHAGIYSEAPWQITHNLFGDQPAVVSEAEGPTYGAAKERLLLSCRAQLELEAKQRPGKPLSVRGEICRIVLDGITEPA